jgi:beta-glucosidase
MSKRFSRVAVFLGVAAACVVQADEWAWKKTMDYRVAESRPQTGAPVFTDRPYCFGEVPECLTGTRYIMTAMADKTSDPSMPLLKLDLSGPATVLIACDKRFLKRPDWQREWTDTGNSLVIPECAPFQILEKNVDAGELILHGNGLPSSGAMYLVFVRSKDGSVESVLRCAGRATTVTPPVPMPVYQPKPAFDEYITPEMEKAVEKVLAQMTVDEKLTMLSGDITGRGPMTRGSAYVDRVGIDTMIFYNGPRGYGNHGKGGTLFPCGVGQAASFSPELAETISGAVARELLSSGWQVLEAPSINIIRDPLNGRNFEYFTEDPYLNARLTGPFVRGIQREGAVATAKHLVANNRETNRNEVNAVVGERALREIYLPAFKAACDAGVLSIMTGANRVNGPHASDNPYLINILKREWNWSGFLYTDWNSAQTTVEAFDAGLDLSMPGRPTRAFSLDKLQRAYEAGLLDDQALDDKMRRVLRGCYFAGKLKGSPAHPEVIVDYEDHHQKAYEAAVAGMTLVKNERQALPIRDTDRRIAVIGPLADKRFSEETGGSSGVHNTPYDISALEGLRKHFGEDRISTVPLSMDGAYELLRAPFVYHVDADGKRLPGFQALYTGNDPGTLAPAEVTRPEEVIAFNWEMASPDRQKLSPARFAADWTGRLVPPESGHYTFRITGTQRVYLYLDGELVLNKEWMQNEREATLDLEAGREYEFKLSFNKIFKHIDGLIRFSWIRPDRQQQVADSLEQSVQAAAGADVALVVVGLDHNTEAEGMDRHTMRLPEYHDQLIERVRAVNPRTVVVAYCGTPIAMDPWFESVPAVVLPWFPGIENGNALAAVLSGERDFGGRTPITFPKKYEDSPAHPSRQKADKDDVIEHNEGIFVGYRWFDHEGIEPLIPFGHGLSYATFEYSNLNVDASQFPVRVSVDVSNGSERDGTEVVQLYVADPEIRLPRPVRELKEFKRVPLAAGETRTVRFELPRESFSYYDPQLSGWTLEPGRFVIEIGRSSRNLVLKRSIQLAADSVQ